MKCPKCESSNIQSHILVEDKRSRNMKIALVVLLIALVIAFCLSSGNMFGFAILAVMISVPTALVLKIVLAFIPECKTIIFVCNECGEEFKKDQSK